MTHPQADDSELVLLVNNHNLLCSYDIIQKENF